ncbi:MAG: uroporphyrinogen decarboxylase family protein [Spirochaetia bacterium]
MPEVDSGGRFDRDKLIQQVKAFHDAGYFVQGSVMGVWYGIYYYLTKFDNILMFMACEPEAARKLFDMTGRFSLESAKILLECGVDSIFTPSDLGSGQGLLFSPAMFREYVYPWLNELADLAHAYGAYLHLHSHGHIQDIMDGIVEAGVDIINPVGPSDHNDLEYFKKHWGKEITFHGGISTTISEMSEEQMRKHVKEVIETGRKGGRFIPRTESGIPPMPVEIILPQPVC